MAVLTILLLVGSACSGEVAVDTVQPDDAATSTADGSSDDDPTAEPTAAADEPTPVPDEPAAPDDGDTDTGGETDGGDAAPAASIYEDPRGGIFADFQATFDRSHPFEQLDSMCIAHPAAENRVATDPGITADAIEVQHMRQQLELLVNLGFGVDVGDVAGMFEALVAEINEECGGVRGRLLDLEMSEFSALDESTQITSCIEATEDRNAVIAMNSSGMQGNGPLCIAAEHDTLLITTQSLGQEQLDEAGGLLITLDRTQDDMLKILANLVHDRGLLDGKTIGVVGVDTPGQPDAVASGLVETLESLGYEVAVYNTLQCSGSPICQGGLVDSVREMLDNDVDALFPVMNVLTTPSYFNEMTQQGFVPGDVQFFTSNFNSMGGDLTLSKIVASGSVEGGELVSGMFTTDSAETGNYKLDDQVVPPFNQMCIDTYERRTGILHGYGDETDLNHTKQGMLSVVCSEIIMAARAIYDAGDNPTRADIAEAMVNLGPVDTNNMLVATIEPGKYSSQNAFQTLTWTYPCELPPPFDENDTCLVPNNDYFLVDTLLN